MPNRPLRHLMVLVALVPLLLLTAGCGRSSPDLVIYSGRSVNLVEPILEKFSKASGLKIEVRGGDSAELAAQILEEGDKTPADLFFSQDAGALGALSKAGLLAPLPTQVLDRVPARYRAADGTWVGTSGRSRVIIYDPRKVPQPPKSVFELTDPKWRGQIGWAPTNASFQAFVTAMRVTSGEEKTRQWLEAMKANGTQVYPNNVAIRDAVDNGQLSMGLINHYYWYEKVAEVGADKVPSKLAFLPGDDPGALVNVAGVGILKSARHPAAALRAVEYLLSPEAQQYFADETKEYPLAAGVPVDPGLPPLDSLQGPKVDLGRLDSLQQTLALLKQVGLL